MNGTPCAMNTMPPCCMDVQVAKHPVLIVFDLDGTLTDSAMLGRILFKKVFARMGCGEISDELADSFNGPTAEEVCCIMGIGPERREEYDHLIDEIETELVRTIGKVYPGTAEMLATLAPHAHLTILTNGAPAYAQACIEHYGFAPYVTLYSGFAPGITKAMRIAMWEQRLGARRVIVVGDRASDIQNARIAQAYAIGVTFGMGSREELADADELCDNIQQVTQSCLRIIETQ